MKTLAAAGAKPESVVSCAKEKPGLLLVTEDRVEDSNSPIPDSADAGAGGRDSPDPSYHKLSQMAFVSIAALTRRASALSFTKHYGSTYVVPIASERRNEADH